MKLGWKISLLCTFSEIIFCWVTRFSPSSVRQWHWTRSPGTTCSCQLIPCPYLACVRPEGPTPSLPMWVQPKGGGPVPSPGNPFPPLDHGQSGMVKYLSNWGTKLKQKYTLEQSFSSSALLTFGLGDPLLWAAVLCTVGFGAAFTGLLPLNASSKDTPAVTRHDVTRHFQLSPRGYGCGK